MLKTATHRQTNDSKTAVGIFRLVLTPLARSKYGLCIAIDREESEHRQKIPSENAVEYFYVGLPTYARRGLICALQVTDKQVNWLGTEKPRGGSIVGQLCKKSKREETIF